MRYPDGGGLNSAARERREQVRRQAAVMFERAIPPPEAARRLRVSRKSAYAWHRAWVDSGVAALDSHGAGGARCQLDAAQLARLEADLEAGPAVGGFIEDQRWTLARIAELIHRLFGIDYTVQETCKSVS